MSGFRQTWMVYGAAMACSSLGIALQVRANLGVSMVAAPAYILSLKWTWLSFGRVEWLVQGLLFLLCCLLTGRVQWRFLSSFAVAIPYGILLDGMLWLCRGVAPMGLAARLAVFLVGCVVLALGIALFFRSDLPCQMYEMFVKAMADHWRVPQARVKLIYDWSSLLLAIALTLACFQTFKGIGPGTVLCTVVNAPLIGLWERVLLHSNI